MYNPNGAIYSIDEDTVSISQRLFCEIQQTQYRGYPSTGERHLFDSLQTLNLGIIQIVKLIIKNLFILAGEQMKIFFMYVSLIIYSCSGKIIISLRVSDNFSIVTFIISRGINEPAFSGHSMKQKLDEKIYSSKPISKSSASFSTR